MVKTELGDKLALFSCVWLKENSPPNAILLFTAKAEPIIKPNISASASNDLVKETPLYKTTESTDFTAVKFKVAELFFIYLSFKAWE